MDKYVNNLENHLGLVVKHMIDNNQFKNIIDDIKNILNKLNDTECDNDEKSYVLLTELLKINLVLVNKSKGQRIDCDIKDLLLSLQEKSEDRTIIHELVLLTILNKETDGVIKELLRLKTNDLLHLEILEGVIDGLILTKDESEIDIDDIIKYIETDDKNIYKKVVNDVIPKYCKRVGGSTLLETISNKIDDVTLLDIACGLDELIPVLLKKNGFVNDTIRKYLVNGTFTEKKKCIYVLNKIVFKYNRMDVSSEDAWKNFFIISETTSEKQYHLVQPTFKLVPTLKKLDIPWRLCVIAQYINHPHKEIVKYTIKKILQNDWDYDMKLLVNALNNSFVFENDSDIPNHLNTFITELSTEKFTGFIESYTTIKNPNPSATYIIFNSFLQRKFEFNKNLCEKLLEFTTEIKHVFLKKAIQFSLARFVTTISLDLKDLKDFVSIIDLMYEKGICREYVQKCIGNMFKTHPNKLDVYEMIIKEMSDYVPLIFLLYDQDTKYIEKVHEHLKFIWESESVCDLKLFCEILTAFFIDLDPPPDLENKLTEQEMLDYSIKLLRKIIVEYDEISSINPVGTILKFSYPLYLSEDVVTGLLNSAEGHKKYMLYLLIWKTYRNRYYINKALSIETAIDYIENNNLIGYIPKFYNSVKCIHTSSQENAIDKLNDILDVRHDITDEIIHGIRLVIFKHYKVNSDGVYAEKIKKLIERCIDDLLYKGVASVLHTELIHLLHMIEVIIDKVLKEVLISFVKRIYENSYVCDDYSMLRNMFVEIYASTYLPPDVNSEMLLAVSNYVIVESLLNAPLLRKDQRLEHEISYDIEEKQMEFLEKYQMTERIPNYCLCSDDSFYLRTTKCLADTHVRKYALSIAFKLYQRVNKKNYFYFIIQQLLIKYHETYLKRYFLNSQLHFRKLSILQYMVMASKFFLKYDKDILDQMHKFLHAALANEAHQTSTKILIQWLLSKVLYEISTRFSTFDTEMTNLIKYINGLKGQTIGNFFPIVYHLSKKCKKDSVHNAMKLLIGHSMGPCFNLRYNAQLTFKYIQDHWKLGKYQLQYEAIVEVLEQTKLSSIQDPFNLAFLNIIESDAEFMTFETIYYDLPRLTGVQKTFWINDLHLSEIGFSDNKVSELRKLEPVTPKSVETEEDDSSMNVQKKIETWDYESTDRNNLDGELIVVASLIDRLPNLGGLSRTCEIFGVKKYVLNNSLIVKNNEYKNLSMSSEKWVEIEEVKINDLGEYLKRMKKFGYNIVGVEQTAESRKLNEYKFPKKTILVLGNEREGIPANLIPLMDICLEIPQFGQIRSLNVHVAGALFIWEYTKQFCDIQDDGVE